MADRNTVLDSGMFHQVPIAAATVVEAGKIGARNAGGYLVPAADQAGLVVCGRIEDGTDNATGGNGAVEVSCRKGEAYWFANSAVTAVVLADLEGPVYVEDGQTVTTLAGATNDIVVGTALQLDSVMGVKVFIPIG